MKISKVYFFMFAFGMISNRDLYSMTAGGSRRYRDFMEELRKPSPNASTLSDFYYEIENEKEQRDLLEETTKKKIVIAGQEEEQKKIRKQLKLLSKKTSKVETEQLQKSNKLQDFERDLKIGATRKNLQQSLANFSGNELSQALELATKYNIIFPEYAEQRKFISESDKLSDEYDNLIIQTDLLEQKNREAKEDIHIRLTLAERAQAKKEDLAKLQKRAKQLEENIKELSGQSDIKSSRVDALLRSQNQQLKAQNEALNVQLAKLQKRIQELKDLQAIKK